MIFAFDERRSINCKLKCSFYFLFMDTGSYRLCISSLVHDCLPHLLIFTSIWQHGSRSSLPIMQGVVEHHIILVILI